MNISVSMNEAWPSKWSGPLTHISKYLWSEQPGKGLVGILVFQYFGILAFQYIGILATTFMICLHQAAGPLWLTINDQNMFDSGWSCNHHRFNQMPNIDSQISNSDAANIYFHISGCDQILNIKYQPEAKYWLLMINLRPNMGRSQISNSAVGQVMTSEMTCLLGFCASLPGKTNVHNQNNNVASIIRLYMITYHHFMVTSKDLWCTWCFQESSCI